MDLAHLLPIEFPVFVIEERVDGDDHRLIISGRLDPVPIPSSVTDASSASHRWTDDDDDDDAPLSIFAFRKSKSFLK